MTTKELGKTWTLRSQDTRTLDACTLCCLRPTSGVTRADGLRNNPARNAHPETVSDVITFRRLWWFEHDCLCQPKVDHKEEFKVTRKRGRQRHRWGDHITRDTRPSLLAAKRCALKMVVLQQRSSWPTP